jgi:hypothetical protein
MESLATLMGINGDGMTRIGVDIGRLNAGAGEGVAIASELHATRGVLDGATPSAAAAGAAGAVAAIGEACAGWSRSLGTMGDAVAQLHGNLAAAAAAYAETDERAIDP